VIGQTVPTQNLPTRVAASMRVAVFNTKPYDQRFLERANAHFNHELLFLEPHLNVQTARLAEGCGVVCTFVNDVLDTATLEVLSNLSVRLVALRCAGFNQVDLRAAARLGMTVVRVPAYSPFAVAEHAVALILTLNRNIHRAYNRVREGNFELEGLLGFDLHGKTVGVIGTGKIGAIFAGIMLGFGVRVLAHDPFPNADLQVEHQVEYVTLESLLTQSDVISLHCPLSPQTRHLIDASSLKHFKHGAMLVNTSRGALIDTPAAIDALKSGRIGALALDVYEEEGDLFFENLSNQMIQDDVFSRLLTFPNVLITGHQAFFTNEALENIARTTLENITVFSGGTGTMFEVPTK
jgi:D-lactate dehydrogenase